MVPRSFLDELLSADVAPARDGATPRLSVDRAKASVARDVEQLLNARRPFDDEALAAWPHASRSVVGLGLADLSAMSLASERDRQRIAEAIRQVLATHERRLADVVVALRDGAPGATRVGYTIHARLRLDAATESVAFDAVLHPGSMRVDVVATGAAVAAAGR